MADALKDVPDVKVLNDRRVPGTKRNIDHILVAPAGVFVVDAKYYKGLIQIRQVGGLFKAEARLYVGSRDCSHLAAGMRWQVQAVQQALLASGVDPTPPVKPVLCFVDGDWSLLFAPEQFNGVRLDGLRSIKKAITATKLLVTGEVDHINHVLASAFPPK